MGGLETRARVAEPRREEQSVRPFLSALPHNGLRRAGRVCFGEAKRGAGEYRVRELPRAVAGPRKLARQRENNPSGSRPMHRLPRPREQPVIRLRHVLGKDSSRQSRFGSEGGAMNINRLRNHAAGLVLLTWIMWLGLILAPDWNPL